MKEGISILIVSALVLSVLGMALAIAAETNPPSVTNPEASPFIIANDGGEYTELTVDVTDDTAINNATVDLTSIGGKVVNMTCKANYTDGDKIISVFNYTTNATCSPGTYNLPINATDIYNNSNIGYIMLTVEGPWSLDMDVYLDYDFKGVRTFGMNESATDLFDDGIDDTAPPAEMTGFDVFFSEAEASPKDRLSIDIKSLEYPKNWTLVVTSPKKNTTNVTWNTAEIPSDVYLEMEDLNTHETIDMSVQNFVTVEGGEWAADTKPFKITAVKGIPVVIPLMAGWNMISVPKVPENASVDYILPDRVGSVWMWDGEKYVSASTLEPKKGYWVAMSESKQVNFTGTHPQNTTLYLNAGWNMIGLPVQYNVSTDVFGPNRVGSVWTWDGEKYVSASTLEPKKGYWVAMNESTQIAL